MWLIFVLTVGWTAYPAAFGSIASTLSVALIVAASGIRPSPGRWRAGRGDRRALPRLHAVAVSRGHAPNGEVAAVDHGDQLGRAVRHDAGDSEPPHALRLVVHRHETDVRRPVGEPVEGRYRRARRAFAVHSSHAVDQGGMPATAETRFVRSAGLSSSPKAPSDRGRARLRPIHGSNDAIVSGC